MTYTLRPISDRTMFGGKHHRSQFDTPWPKTERLLLSEIAHLKGRDVVVEIDVTELDIRNDGRIRASARPATPGVRVAFDSKHGPLTYATDEFTYWQDNVRAIALGLQALRAVDRYGITKNAEQYVGWKAIGSGSGATAMGGMTKDQALDILATANALPAEHFNTNPHLLRHSWRRARRDAHPDKHAGDQSQWDRVEQAAKVLGLL